MKFLKFTILALTLAAGVAVATQARADNFHLGPNNGTSITFNTDGTTGTSQTYTGGSWGDGSPPTDWSTLNGQILPWVFCVDLGHTIGSPDDYNATTVTNTGYVHGSLVNNAAAIAYVLSNFATAGVDSAAVQGAIWVLEYGNNAATVTAIGGSTSDSRVALANLYVTDARNYAGPSLISQFAWLSPMKPGDTTLYQGLVTIVVPEPASFAIAGLAGLGMLSYVRRRRGR